MFNLVDGLKVISHCLYVGQPVANNIGVLLAPSNANLWTEVEVARRKYEGLRQCDLSEFSFRRSKVLINGLAEHQGLMERHRADRVGEKEVHFLFWQCA